MKYPRVNISERVHARVLRASKKQGKPMNKLGDKIVTAGLKALGW